MLPPVLLLLGILSVMSILSPSVAGQGVSHRQVVQAFVEADFRGERLAGAGSAKLADLVSWHAESDWHTLVVVEHFQIGDSHQGLVAVEYRVLGLCRDGRPRRFERQDRQHFEVVEQRGRPVIRAPVLPPHVSHAVACQRFHCCFPVAGR